MISNFPIGQNQMIPLGLHTLSQCFSKQTKNSEYLTRLITAPCHINTHNMLDHRYNEVAKSIVSSYLGFFTNGYADHPVKVRHSYRIDCSITKDCK